MTSGSTPPHRGWRPGDRLTQIEDEILTAAAAGEKATHGEGPFDLAAMKKWGPRQTVRAAVLRHLLVEDEWPVHAKGVHLRGVRISGQLDLEVAELRCPLRLEHCYFPNPRPVNLDYASVSLLTLTGCRLAGLRGDNLTVTKELDFSASTFTSQLRLPGADITGGFSCTGAHLNGGGDALVADRVRVCGSVFLDGVFTTAGAVRLVNANVTGQLSCRGAALTGTDSDGNALAADGIRVGGSVFLDRGFTAAGAVRLPNGVTGPLFCGGATLTGTDRDGNSLFAEFISVGGSVLLVGGFTAAGAVRLPAADISGLLSCSGARLTGTDRDGNALFADRMKAGGVYLDQRFTAAGAVRLPAADISGLLSCSGARLTGTDGDGAALIADDIKVGGDVVIDEEFSWAGTLSLRSARLEGSLHLQPSGFAEANGKVAIDASGAHIARKLLWAPSTQVEGMVVLEDAKVGQLVDDLTQDRSVNGHWPSAAAGMLRLDGFTYTRIGGSHQGTLEQRLAWIGSHSKRAATSTTTRFASQPYEQLAKVYRQAGQDKEARKVAVARRRDLRRYGDLSRSRKLGNWLLDKTIQYGYQAWRAVAGIIVLYAAVLVFLWFARYHNAFIPLQATTGLHPAPTAANCNSRYPCFNPFGFAIDTVIPLINVHQADVWGLNESVPWGTAAVAVTYLGTGFGWILATLAVAGYTGLVRNIDAP